MLTRSIMLRLSTSSSLNVPERLPSFSNQSRGVNFLHSLAENSAQPYCCGAKGAAMKSIITPVLDNAGIIGFIVEYMPDYVEAYFDGELLGSFSSKAEAAAELLLHTERGAFAQ